MVDKDVLKDIGLSENEAEVYLVLLRLTEALASQIAKQTKIIRTNVYDVINKLVEKGLITYTIKNGKKYFKPIEPSRLLEQLSEKEQRLKEILPELQQLYAPLKRRTRIEIYEGSEGLKTILNDILKTGKEIRAFGASDRVKEYLPEFFIKKYIREREKKKIYARQLFTEGTKVIQTKVSQFKALPKQFSSPSTTVIYGNKVTIWIWEEIPIVVLIESEQVYKLYKEHFELMWNYIKAPAHI